MAEIVHHAVERVECHGLLRVTPSAKHDGVGPLGALDEKIRLLDFPSGTTDATEGICHDVFARDDVGL